jgi:ribonuclease BN (tRNA processing enzyme)
LKDKKGWGHSSWLEGVKIAQGAGVRKFVLFHYEPDDDDSAVDRLVADARKHFPHTCGAREGMVLQIPNGVSHEHAA